MRKLEGSKTLLASVPLHHVVAVVTSRPDYEMSRLVYVEDWPEYDDRTVIEGSHCSCYDFDDTQWEGIAYTRDELRVVAENWKGQGYGLEPVLAPLVLEQLA